MKKGQLPVWFENTTRNLSGKPFPDTDGIVNTGYLDALVKGNHFKDIDWDNKILSSFV